MKESLESYIQKQEIAKERAERCKKQKCNFLRGVIDGDGSPKTQTNITICSGSREFLEDINILFEDLNILPKRVLEDETSFVINIANKRDVGIIYEECYKNNIYCYPRKIMKTERIIFKNE
mgnify:CR=1 FL=1